MSRLVALVGYVEAQQRVADHDTVLALEGVGRAVAFFARFDVAVSSRHRATRTLLATRSEKIAEGVARARNAAKTTACPFPSLDRPLACESVGSPGRGPWAHGIEPCDPSSAMRPNERESATVLPRRAPRAIALALAAAVCASCADAPPASPTACVACAAEGGVVDGLAAGAVSAAGIFAEMGGLGHLGVLPEPPWISGFASSRDRNAVSPDAPGWFANADATGFIRVEGEERVMLDARGPGVIVRMWSADPRGTWRIYLDGATTPAVAVDAQRLFRGEVAPFVAPFAFSLAGGANLLYPIPFRERVKVTTTAPTLYYGIDYRLYPPGTPLIGFREGSDAGAARESARAALLGAFTASEGATRAGHLRSDVDEAFALDAPPGGGVITRLTLTVDRTDAVALRRTVLRGTFDGAMTIDAPLGDVFGLHEDGIDVRALPISADHAGQLTLRLPMPFASRAQLRLVDVGGGPVRARVVAVVAARRFDARSMHLHVRWTGVRSLDAFTPGHFRVARVRGAGVYVGTALNVANPNPAWWGEGDEQVWVDGEPFPSRFGTGTEDYFGYAWCSTQRFTHPLYGQTRANTTNFAGTTSLYRFHIVDAIPFTTSLTFDLEALHWASGNTHATVHYDAVYYLYARPGAVLDDADRAPEDYVTPALPESVVERGDGATHC